MSRAAARSVARVLDSSSDLWRAAFSTAHKQTTGIVGLPMKEAARAELQTKVADVLAALDAFSIPKTAAYRKAVEDRCGNLNTQLQTQASDAELEGILGRQLEEEIKLCDDELGLIPSMAEWKPWKAAGTVNVVEDGSGEPVAQEGGADDK